MTKDNIMKMTDGLFHAVFDEISAEYPDVETEHLIIDIGMARVADSPERFDVIVTSNLYGDIMSDVADRVNNAWLRTIEDGIHTGDIHREGTSTERVGTDRFAQAVISRLGKQPQELKPTDEPSVDMLKTQPIRRPPIAKTRVGVDVFLHVQWKEGEPQGLAQDLLEACPPALKLEMIDSRGLVIWPDGTPSTVRTDYCRCRFEATGVADLTHQHVLHLLGNLAEWGRDFTGVELLYNYDGQRVFSRAQGHSSR